MIIHTFEQALKLANEFLVTKERKNFYEFECIDEIFDKSVCYANELSDDEVSKINQLKEKYPDNYVLHLNEIFDAPDNICNFSEGQELVSIDTDYVMHKYAVTIYIVQLPNKQLQSFSDEIILTDVEYTRLLAWHLLYKNITMNSLYYYDRNLFSAITRNIDNYFYQLEGYMMVANNPYCASLDEAIADAEAIINLHNIERFDGGGIFAI